MTRNKEISLIVIVALVVGLGAWWLSGDQVKAPTENSNTSTNTKLQIVYIQYNDNGQNGPAVGCGDSAVKTTTTANAFLAESESKISAALNALVTNDQATIGSVPYYNTLANSSLTVDSVSLSNGTATVEMSGQLSLGGECDNPRVQAQLEQTVIANGATTANIQLNGKPLSEALSLQ